MCSLGGSEHNGFFSCSANRFLFEPLLSFGIDGKSSPRSVWLFCWVCRGSTSSQCKAQEKRSESNVGPMCFLFLVFDCLCVWIHNMKWRIQQEYMELNHSPWHQAYLKSHTCSSTFLPLFLLLSGQQEPKPCFTGVLQGLINYKRFEDEKHLLVVCFIQLSEWLQTDLKKCIPFLRCLFRP